MTLGDILERLKSFDDNAVILVASPSAVTAETSAVVVDESSGMEGYEYLLEVAIAKEVIDTWSTWRGGLVPNRHQRSEAVAYCAYRDAYLPVGEESP